MKMKIAKEIAEAAVEFAAERNGDVCACELEPIITAKLEPVKEALLSAKMCLPDSAGYDESWEWAWNELSSESQSQVKAIRAEIEDAIARLSEEE